MLWRVDADSRVKGLYLNLNPRKGNDLIRSRSIQSADFLQIPTSVHSLVHYNTTGVDPGRDDILIVRPTDSHAANLLETGVDVLDELQGFGREDRDGVAAGVEQLGVRADVAVGRVEVLLRERFRCGGEDELGGGVGASFGDVGRKDGGACYNRGLVAVDGRNGLRGEGVVELVYSENGIIYE